MEKEFVYTKVKELGKVDNLTVEIGHYTVNGKESADKIYIVKHFERKDGTLDDRATAVCDLNQAKEIGKLLEKA